MTELTLGYKASAEQFAPNDLLDFSVHAEERGFDSIVVSDHFQPWRHTDGHAPYSFAWMGALAARTKRARLGTSVVTPTFRYHPAIVAQAMGTLDQLSGGRCFLGVGTGESLNEIPVLGIEWPGFKERFGRLREAVDLMRQLWTTERVNFRGEFYETHDANIYDRPELPIPVYVAAGGPLVARYAGRAGDGFICTSGKGMSLYTDELIPAVKEGADKAGKSFDDIDRMIEIKLSYDTDADAALENTRFWAPLALSKEQKHDITDPVEMEKAADALPIEQIASRWIVGSDPDEVVAGVKQYVDAGFTHLVFHAPGEDQERFLGAFAEQVAPGLRELSAAG